MRLMVQIFFFVLIALISVNKTLTAAGLGIPFLATASLHALCPFGGVETLYTLMTTRVFMAQTQVSSVILMSLVFLLALFFGPVFCGWVCPFGAFQEWIGKIGKKLFKKRYNQFIPPKVHGILRYFRYVVLVWVLVVTAVSGNLLFANIDPYHALFKFWTLTVPLSALILLGIITVTSLFVERPWCKYACPYGALLGLFNKIRIFKIRRNPDTCVSCQKCSRTCSMKIDICSNETVSNVNCISCFECTSERSCPKPETLVLRAGGLFRHQGKGLTMPVLSLMIVGIILSGIFASMTLGIWETKAEKNKADGGKNKVVSEQLSGLGQGHSDDQYQ